MPVTLTVWRRQQCKCLLFWIAIVSCAGAANAQPIAVSNGNFNDRFGGFVIGFEFLVGDNPITINALGVYDKDGDGLGAAHDVGIWDDNVDGVALRTVNVPAGTDGQLEDVFRYMSVEELILEANTSYWIGAADFTIDPFSDPATGGDGGQSYVAGEDVTLTFNRYAGGTTLTKPVLDGTFVPGRWAGGNATFLGTTPPKLVGDINLDNVVDRKDVAEFVTHYGATDSVFTTGDFSDPADMITGLDDLALLQQHYGEFAPIPGDSPTAVPEPSTLFLLVASIPAFGFRRFRRLSRSSSYQ